MINTLKPCPFCGREMNKDNTLEWLRDSENGIVVVSADREVGNDARG